MDPTNQAALSALRTIIAFGAGLAVANGYLKADQAAELVGAVMVVIPLAWGMYQKRQAENATKVREVAAVQAGVVASRAGAAPVKATSIDHADAKEIIQTFAPALDDH